MTLTKVQIKERIVRLFQDNYPQDIGDGKEIDLEAHLEDEFGLDSLDLIEFTMGLEEEFDCCIAENVAESIFTIQKAIDVVAKILL